MPLYGASVPVGIYPGDTATVINAETLTTGQASIPVAIGYNPLSKPSISVLLTFSAAPGAFEVDIQQADSDVAAQYLNVPVAPTITAVDAVTFTARTDLSPFLGKFCRLLMKTQAANAGVTLIAKVSAQ